MMMCFVCRSSTVCHISVSKKGTTNDVRVVVRGFPMSPIKTNISERGVCAAKQ